MTVYTKPKKYIYSVIILTGILLFQEILARLIFPMPEVLNFNRINYSPTHISHDSIDEIKKHKAVMNRKFLIASELDKVAYHHTTNLYGFRDKQWDIDNTSKKRLLFIGDSIVESVVAGDNKTITYLFNQFIEKSGKQWEVYNLGVIGSNIERYTHLFYDAANLLQPDEIILVLYANDFNEITPLSELKSKNEKFNPPESLEFIYNNLLTPRIIQVITRLYKDYTVPLAWYSRPYQYFKPVPHPSNPWTSKEHEYSKFINKHIAKAMKKGTFNPFIVNRSNIIVNKYQHIDMKIKNYIIFMHNYSVARDFRFSIIYVPTAEMVSDYYLPFRYAYAKNKNMISMTGKEYQLQETFIKKFTAELNIPFFSLKPHIKKQEALGNHLYWNYDHHFRPIGNIFITNKMYRWWSAKNNTDIKNTTKKRIEYYIDGYDKWIPYTDRLGTGSNITLINKNSQLNGNLTVTMTKAADMSLHNKSSIFYPYVGISVDFNHDGSIFDLSAADNITLKYRLSGPMCLLLSQKGVNKGEEFRINLPPSDVFTTIQLNWKDFYQPDWVKSPSKLDLTQLTGIKFQITTPNKNHSTLGIHSLIFPSRSK